MGENKTAIVGDDYADVADVAENAKIKKTETLVSKAELEKATELLDKKKRQAYVFQKIRDHFLVYDFEAGYKESLSQMNAWEDAYNHGGENATIEDMRFNAQGRKDFNNLLEELKNQGYEAEIKSLSPSIERFKKERDNVAFYAQQIWNDMRWEEGGYNMENFDKVLCGDILGFEPEGTVAVEILPTAVHIAFYNPEDYDRAYFYKDTPPINDKFTPHEEIAGFKTRAQDIGIDVTAEFISGKKIKSLRDLASTQYHEEGHSIDASIFEITDSNGDSIYDYETREPLMAASEENTERLLKKLAEQYEKTNAYRAIDELLAYCRDRDWSPKDIQQELTKPEAKKGVYDYYNDEKAGYDALFFRLLNNNPNYDFPKHAERLVRMFELARRRHNQMIERLSHILDSLYNDLANMDRGELYVWLASEASESNSTEEIEKRWQALADAARVQYIEKAYNDKAAA